MFLPALHRPRAVLVGVQLPDMTAEQHAASLAELRRLTRTLGASVIATVSQRRSALAHAAVLGTGKLRDLGHFTGGSGIVPVGPQKKRSRLDRRAGEATDAESRKDSSEDPADADEGGEAAEADELPEAERANLVIVDHEITPSQARNLERATGVAVLDRTALILEIFQRHARSREARIQVEIARLQYMAPRLRDQGVKHDRQRGGIGGKGAGESSLELDRRKVRDRIAELRHELASVEQTRGVRRARRAEELRVALVGYTNAGKSSWMRDLTGSEVLVEDKLFATLDTTVRVMQPETHPRILVSDTVGFIKKLPHDLVASFRSTLDEALEASLLVHVADGSDPDLPAQLETTRRVLEEIGAGEVPNLLVLNKSDRFDPALAEQLALEHPDGLLLSALRPADVGVLRAAIVSFFERDMIDGELFLPYGRRALLPEIHRHARVLEEKHDESGTLFRLRTHPETLARLRSLL